MKKLLFLLSFTFTILANAQTAIYHPFPETNTAWNVQRVWYCWISSGPIGESYSITFSNDTIINNQNYHKLSEPYLHTNTTFCGSGYTIYNVYKGAIRQDVSMKKVYIVPSTDTTEQLLYDFTMQVGDTVKGYLETSTYPKDIVQSIDSVIVGSSYRKRWNINLSYNISIIEGVGSTYGLVELSPGGGTDAPEYSITCFQQNGQALYPNTTAPCELFTSINSTSNISNQIIVFPNPSQSSFTIDVGKLKVKEIRLVDLLGRIVFDQKNNIQEKININNLPKGAYVLTIIDMDNNSTDKKIITGL